MNHIKTMLGGHYIGIDRLERIKLLQGDPLINEFDISVKESETVSRFLGNFNHKTTQMLLEECCATIHQFQGLQKAVEKEKLKSIIIDIDSNVVNVEDHQEGAVTRRVLRERIQSQEAWKQLLQHTVRFL
jgi:hypothetical protein